MLKRLLVLAMSAGSLLLPATPAAPSALAWSTDFTATRQRMAAAGYAELAHDRDFLAFDPAGDGRAVEVIGELAAATRIVVLVPGSDTTLPDFDRGLGGVARRAPSVQARQLYDAATARDAEVAVVAWLGYDPPEGLGLAALRQERAAAGAAALADFVGSLRPQATVVVVGHSYGSVVMALAAADLGPRVTDLVALGSPGLGDLSTSARLWVATAPTDWIRNVPKVSLAGFGHGTDPASPHLAARTLPTDGVAGHDYYLVPGSPTLAALAEIIAIARP